MTRGSPQILLSALECVKIRKSHRERINQILLKSRSPSLLYGLIIADERLVSVVRPKRHSLHPPDLQLLFSMLFNASTFRDGGEHWTPICLPKFNNRGFLHAYICFFRKEVACVLISADKDAFFEMRSVKETVVEQLEKTGSVKIVEDAVSRGRYTTTDVLSSTVIRHFLYKSRANVQFTMPSFEPHFYTVIARRRFVPPVLSLRYLLIQGITQTDEPLPTPPLGSPRQKRTPEGPPLHSQQLRVVVLGYARVRVVLCRRRWGGQRCAGEGSDGDCELG